MVAGPLRRWRRDDGRTLWTRLPLAFFAGAVVLFALVLFGGMIGILPLLGMTVAAIVAVASLAPLWKRNLRSEEHTSELQSLMRISYAVFCLKKKKNYTQ